MDKKNSSFNKSFVIRSLVVAVAVSSQIALADDAKKLGPSAEVIATVTSVADTVKTDVHDLYKVLSADARSAMGRLKNYPNLNSYSAIDPRSWIFASRESEQARLVRQMDFAKNQLGDSRLVRLKTLFDSRQAEIASLRQELVNLKLELQGAVSKKELHWLTQLLLPILPDFVAPAVTENITAQIAKNEGKIQQLKADCVYLTGQIGDSLRDLGVQIDSHQLDILMTTVTGKQDLQLIAAFNNVRRLVELIQSQLKSDTAIEMAREYYGMYTLMLAALVQMQNSQIDRINNVYLARLSSLSNKVALNSAQADDLMKESRNKEMLEVNRKANDQMATLIGRYREFLTAKVTRIRKSADEQQKVYLEALNTYSTYDVAIGLLEAIETHQKELRTFDSAILELPKLIDLGDMSLNQQISRISVEIDRN